MPNYPPHVARLIEKGKTSPITTISGAPVFDEDKHENIMSTMHKNADVDFINQVTDNQCIQVAAISGGRLLSLSFCKIMRVSDDAHLYALTASCSDSLSTPAPCTFDRSILQEKFVAIVPKTYAQRWHLPTSTIDPEDIGSRDGSVEGSLGRLALEGYFPLPTEDDGDDAGFAFAGLPRLFRLTPGKPIPSGTNLDELGDTLATSYPELHVWCCAQRWLADKNNNRGITSNDGLMFPEDVVNVDCQNPGPLHGFVFAPNPQVTITMLGPADGLYHRTLTHVTDECDKLYRDLGTTMDPDPTPPQGDTLPNSNTNANTGLTDVLSQIGGIFDKCTDRFSDLATSSKTAENKERADLAKTKMKLMFARITENTGNPDAKRLTPGQLTDYGTDMFSKTRHATIQNSVKQAFKLANDQAGASDKATDDMVSLKEAIVNAKFTQCMMEMQFIDQPLNNLTEESLTNALSLLAFLPVHGEVSAPPTEQTLQVLSTDDQLDQVRKSKIYIKGTCHSPTHLRMMIASFVKFWGILITDVEHSALMTCLLEWFEALKQPYTKDWFSQIEEHQVAPVLANLAATISSDVMRPFVRLSLSTDYRRAIEKGDPISAEGLQRAIDGHKTALREFALCVNRGTPGLMYTQPPRLMEHLNVPVVRSAPRRVGFVDLTTNHASAGDTSKPAAKAKDSKREGKNRTSSSAASGGSDKNKKPKTSVEDRKKLGILIYKKDGTVPDAPPQQPPDIRTKAWNTKGRFEKLCMAFLTRGFTCTNDGCQKAHLANLGQVNGKTKEKIKAFVDSTDGVSFAQGMAPDGETT